MLSRAARTAIFRMAGSVALAICTAASGFVAAPAMAAAEVTLGGDSVTAQHWDAAALARLPRSDVSADDHGKPGHWQGVALTELLKSAGAPLGAALRGPNLALYVRIRGADGYTAVYSLAELDPGIRGEPVILADHRDGKPLDAKEGPFRIIAVADKRPARWVRQVVAIDLLRASRE